MESTSSVVPEGVVVVLGGAGVLGAAIVADLARRGYETLLADRDTIRSQVVVRTLKQSGIMARHESVDTQDLLQVSEFCKSVSRNHEPIAGIINATYPRAPITDVSGVKAEERALASSLEAHLGSFMWVTNHFAELLARQGFGSIVNLVSIYAQSAPRFELYEGTDMSMPVEYAASKSGIVAVTRYYAKLHRRSGIRLNCVAPGGILADQPERFRLRYAEMCGTKGLLDPEDVCGSVAFLVSGDSRYVTGQVLTVDDGWSL